MSALNPLMVGEWDGANLWVQWTPTDPVDGMDAPYRVRVRVRRPGTEWGEWRERGKASPECFRCVQIARQDWEVQAQVCAMLPGAEPQWESATEVTFDRARARFAFTLDESRKAQTMKKGQVVSAVVDGEPCSYKTTGILDLEPGRTVEAEMEAVHFSGWCQLDEPGHFRGEPLIGLTVVNVLPSVNDLMPTVRDGEAAKVTTVLGIHKSGNLPGVLVKTGRNWLRPVVLEG